MSHIILGKLGKPHGIKGWLRVNILSDSPEKMLQPKSWYIQSSLSPRRDGLWQAIDLELKLLGTKLIAHLPSVDTPEDARNYTGCAIGILRSALPALKKNEYYWTDLIGLHVINQEGIELGKITELLATGANDVMRIEGEKNYLIPFVLPQIVTHVDLKMRKIYVDWDY